MKAKHIILSSLILFFCSCGNSADNNQVVEVKTEKTNLEKAKDAISEYVKTDFHDPSSYENIEFGELLERIDYTEKAIMDSLDIEFMNASKEVSPSAFNKEEYEKTLKRFKSAKKELVGYELRNKCRAKNSMGALVVNNYYYIFDKEFKVIGYETEEEHLQKEIEKIISH